MRDHELWVHLFYLYTIAWIAGTIRALAHKWVQSAKRGFFFDKLTEADYDFRWHRTTGERVAVVAKTAVLSFFGWFVIWFLVVLPVARALGG